MYLSPPIAVLAILAAGLASTAWFQPKPPEIARATVVPPAATYQKLAQLGKQQIGGYGLPLTAVQVIEELAKKWDRESEPSMN